ILVLLWRGHTDWFWGINMEVYYEPQKSAIVPDGFLSLGVERLTCTGGRLSYVLWQEEKVPLLAVELAILLLHRRMVYSGDIVINVNFLEAFNVNFLSRSEATLPIPDLCLTVHD
ncbi:MAG: hypothetical protein ACRDEA_05790, partial [Microcystaceae cyanobacterium]